MSLYRPYVPDLAGTACSGESLSLMANLTGEGATGQARVWMKALGVLPKTCDLDIVPPEDSGVVLFFLDAYLRPPVEQGGCLDSMAVFAPTVNGSFSEERLLATCVTGDLMEKVVVSRRPGATVRVELSVGTRDEVSVVGYHVKYSVFGTEVVGAAREDSDPERIASSSDLSPHSSMGSSGGAVSSPLGANCFDVSPGFLGAVVRGGWPRPRGSTGAGGATVESQPVVPLKATSEDSGVVLFFLDAYLRPPVEQGGCLDSMAVFAPTVNGSFSEERLLATCVTGDLMEKVVVSRRPGATVRVELSVGTRDEVSVVGYHVKYSVFGTEVVGAAREDSDPERIASSSDLSPHSSMGSSGGAVSSPLGANCFDVSPGFLGAVVRGGWPRPRGSTGAGGATVESQPVVPLKATSGDRSQCVAQDEFRCKDSNCIWTKFLCDGTPNCPDGSDEFAYSYSRCRDRSQCVAQDEFRCKDSNCIWTKFLCDGTPNCPDGSDEFAYSYSRCRHSLHYGLEMVGFFGAVGGIILVLLALDSFVRYLLEIWRLRQKQTWRTALFRLLLEADPLLRLMIKLPSRLLNLGLETHPLLSFCLKLGLNLPNCIPSHSPVT
ncbi:hypothetical protein ISCGN_020105 [Ixodes scapularis]